MSEKKDDKAEKAGDKGEKPAGKGVNLVGVVITAVLAGAAAFGGAKVAGARAGGHAPQPPAHAAPHIEPPGFTLALEPFLVMAADTNRRTHPMRVVLAVEFEQNVKEENVRPFVPRIRDFTLTYLRSLTYETASNPEHMDHFRADLLERMRGTGAVGVSRVLVTDLVVQ